MKLTVIRDQFVFTCDYTNKEIPRKAGCKWNPNLKSWTTTDYDVIMRLKEYWDDTVEEKFKNLKSERSQRIISSYAISSDVKTPVPKGLKYLPYQKAGIKFAADKDFCLISDEMGLGKTIQAIGVMNHIDSIKTLIICPASLKINWMRECKKWQHKRNLIKIADKEFPDHLIYDVIICNYEQIKRFKKEINLISWDLLICDESHYLKNPKSLRTKNILGGTGIRPIYADKKLFLTGTPIMNRPIELWPILKAAKAFNNWQEYVVKYCAGFKDHYGWNCSGASNLKELGEVLRDKVMIRRLKSQVLHDLPDKIRQIITLEPTNTIKKIIDAESLIIDAYSSKASDCSKKIEEYKSKKSKDSSEYKKIIKELKSAHISFKEMAKVRIKTAMAKVKYVVDYAIDTIEQNGNAIIFAHHHDVINAIKKGLEEKGIITGLITGNESLEERQQAVDDFQAGKIQVIIGSIKAAGVGYTLTRSSNVIFAELDWTPSSISQAEDRCHRIGQKSCVNSVFLVFDGTIDSMIAKKITSKEEVIDQILL